MRLKNKATEKIHSHRLLNVYFFALVFTMFTFQITYIMSLGPFALFLDFFYEIPKHSRISSKNEFSE